jgi:hypothetical protein
MTARKVPEQVVAAITVAVSLTMGVSPERVHVRLKGRAPSDDDRGAWGIAARMDQMRRHRP